MAGISTGESNNVVTVDDGGRGPVRYAAAYLAMRTDAPVKAEYSGADGYVVYEVLLASSSSRRLLSSGYIYEVGQGKAS